MKIILKDDIKGLGSNGQELIVADGYARNYLIPKGFAVAATAGNIKTIENEKSQKRRKIARLKEEAAETAKRLEGISCRLVKNVGESDRLFGSVTTQDIVDQLKKDGFDIDKKKIELDTPIKNLGTYTIPVKLQPDVIAHLKVEVVKE
ncbi:MAG: 50S ribosomal protein L9 [Nitrospinae bacterium]|nr:50S ribosomal protein L9 [Nitrospinota bacterium]